MSSIDDTHELEAEMPAGFHYARLMAYLATLPEDRRSKAAESARQLISHVPPADDAMAELEQIADRLAALLAANPEMVQAFPGGAYWPMRVITDRLRHHGVDIDVARR
jgi:hypothetical protein